MKTLMMILLLMQTPQVVTDQDKAEIQALVTGYARALGSCAANEYADLFADGSYYDDVYEKTAQGNWRFKSRVYVAESPIRTQ